MPNSPYVLALAAVLALPAAAQSVSIDATAPVPPPQPVAAMLGSATSPAGDTLGVNSQYLTFNGKPWIPVMGEFHFSRYPEAQWEEEILKMQAAGVRIVSTYIIWIHHEQVEGKFDWAGQRDLRKFTQLCGKHGMFVYPRIGPWSHAEVRNGGLPDWVLAAGPTRQNDPVYLKEVQTFYQQIALQLRGLLWRDGGPVIGLQVENEYRARGKGKGDEHIRMLKKMAVADGLDVPYYTVTGWDGASIPLDTALPVFGGYPDAPWDGSPKKLSPNEVYAFRFDNRSAGSMGAIGGGIQSAAQTYTGTPFLTAEVGDGIEDTYFRRPVIAADDVANIPTIMLGSGANMMGYYMFHGGRNPEPEPGTDITLNESQVTGYPTDLPLRSYDFQAPLGEYGQQRESLLKLKLVHYFLADFGQILAPMTPRRPAAVPAAPADLSVPRVSARTNGESGFLFLNNHVRDVESPIRPAFQVALKLPGATVNVPEEPIALPAESYGIWPVNLPLGPTTLRYSTAQLFKKVQSAGQTWYFFFAIPGVDPEFAFDGQPAITTNAACHKLPGLLRFRCAASAEAVLHLPGNVNIVELPQAEAEGVWKLPNKSLLLETRNSVFADGDRWTIDSAASNVIDFGLFGTDQAPMGDAAITKAGEGEIFSRYTLTLPAVVMTPKVTEVHPAGAREPSKFGPALSWRKNPVPLAPDDADFTHAAEWMIEVPKPPAGAAISDAYLTFDYTGDVARLYRGAGLVDDNFWNGNPFQAGLREIDSAWRSAKSDYTLRILPLRKDFNLYLQDPSQLHFDANGQTAVLGRVHLDPQYRLVLKAPAGR